MNGMMFSELCQTTAQILNLPLPDNFSNGEVVVVDDVDLQLVQDTNNMNLARLFLELGDIKHEDKVEVYESLFAIQLLMEGVVDGQFVLDNLHDRIMFVVRLPLSDQTEPEQLAGVIQLFVRQVSEWRATILFGRLFDDEFDDALDDDTFSDPPVMQVQPMTMPVSLA